jgi:hypothetical protein
LVKNVAAIDWTNAAGAVLPVSMTRVGAWSGIATTACFVAGIACMAASGVQVLIPPTGQDGRDWIADVDQANGLFFAGAWLVILGGLFGVAALLGFCEALRGGPALLGFAPAAAAVGLALVEISHLIPIALGYEMVPDFTEANGATFDTFAALALVLNYTGDALIWAFVVPLYGWAALKTRVVPRWIGWLGLFVGVTAGVFNLLSPASTLIENLTFIGFVGFFVWIAAMGVALLRRPAAVA